MLVPGGAFTPVYANQQRKNQQGHVDDQGKQIGVLRLHLIQRGAHELAKAMIAKAQISSGIRRLAP